MSHDMRTPLNGIIGLIDICAKHSHDRDLVDASREKARVAAMHLKSLINDTLELSKLECDDAPIYEEAFNLKTVIRDVKTIAKMSADEEGIAFIGKGCEKAVIHPYLMGNPLQVKQIALNLISNAIKYNRDAGSVTVSLIDLTGLRVLLAEDNALNREIASLMLRDGGIEVVQAVDGLEAVESFCSSPAHYFDAVLIDIMMPKMDGRAATRAIRDSGREDALSIPIIAMTANAFDDDKRKSIEAGMDAHISKPLDSATLARTLAKLFKQQRFASADESAR